MVISFNVDAIILDYAVNLTELFSDACDDITSMTLFRFINNAEAS